jgi:hypothetical protein
MHSVNADQQHVLNTLPAALTPAAPTSCSGGEVLRGRLRPTTQLPRTKTPLKFQFIVSPYLDDRNLDDRRLKRNSETR